MSDPDRAGPGDVETVDHVEATVQQMARLHSAHEAGVPRLQKAADFITDRLGRPGVLAVTAAFELVWIVGNLTVQKPFDPNPFSILNLVVSALALNVTLVILSTQRRDDIAARRRAQLTLQMATLSEQKIAKVIALLEEQRRDNPALNDRDDGQAEDMAVAADPGRVLDRIIDTHESGDA